MDRRFAAVCLAGGILLGGCKPDPSKPEYWEKAISSARRTQDKVRTVEELRESKRLDKSHLPMLHAHLATEKGEVKAAIARALGDVKDPSSVTPLGDSVELGTTDSGGQQANKEIANALGRIGDAAGGPALLKLLKTRDNYTRIAAIEALGAMKSKDAFEPLLELATDEGAEPFLSKKAVQALGELADARAVPALLKLMVHERKGVSFYAEASFALFQVGTPAADALIPVLKGEDKAFTAWANQRQIKEAGVLAKAAQVLGDLRDARAVGPLIQRLGYQNEYLDLKLVVRMEAADALGRLRAGAALKPLAAMVGEEEPTARRVYAHALAQLGDREALPALLKAASAGEWELREPALEAVTLLGDDRDKAAMEKAAQGVDGAAKASLQAFAVRLDAAGACKADLACWTKHLDDADAGLRTRAALTLGRSNNPAAVDPLMKRLGEKDLVARLAIIQATSWLVQDSQEAARSAAAALPSVEKQLTAERGRTDFVKVNEDLRRLAVWIRRQAH